MLVREKVQADRGKPRESRVMSSEEAVRPTKESHSQRLACFYIRRAKAKLYFQLLL